jgi:DNA-binding response OmpR family regulator
MVTANSHSADIVEALGLGANDYVAAPVDFPMALARLTAQVERKRSPLRTRR